MPVVSLAAGSQVLPLPKHGSGPPFWACLGRGLRTAGSDRHCQHHACTAGFGDKKYQGLVFFQARPGVAGLFIDKPPVDIPVGINTPVPQIRPYLSGAFSFGQVDSGMQRFGMTGRTLRGDLAGCIGNK